MHRRIRRTDTGWAEVEGSDELTEIEAVPTENEWWPSENAQEGGFVASGVLVDLDLDDVPDRPTYFVAGSLAVDGDTVWVMHSSDPVLLRVDTTADGPNVTRYLLPLTIEPPVDRWARRIHVIEGVYWITSEHDIHCCTVDSDGELSIDRIATEGGRTSAVHKERLYLVGSSSSHMVDDRRHGAIRTYPDAQRLRLLDVTNRRIEPVDGPSAVTATRADRTIGTDGTQWSVDGTDALRRIRSDGSATSIDLSLVTATGSVRSATPDPFTDPANADVVARITVDVSRLHQKPSTAGPGK